MTWNFIKQGSPYGTTEVKGPDGKMRTIPMNRATRRRIAAQMSSRLERLVDQEERHERVRRVTHKEPTGKQLRGRKARAAKRRAYLKRLEEMA
ncbi:MAG: hypothetical protein OEN00_14765 [Gemmatimonadota bacterium]|nr:hypothetical protein [Gemmatimonadota bacterium]